MNGRAVVLENPAGTDVVTSSPHIERAAPDPSRRGEGSEQEAGPAGAAFAFIARKVGEPAAGIVKRLRSLIQGEFARDGNMVVEAAK